MDHEKIQEFKRKIYDDGDLFNYLKQNYPNCVPVIVSPAKSSDPPLSRRTYLAHEQMTLSQFIQTVRKYIKFPSDRTDLGIYFLIAEKDIAPPICLSMAEIHRKYNVDNKYVFLKYTMESTFG